MPLLHVTEPPPTLGEVVVCITDRVEHARIQTALPRAIVLRSCRTTSELSDALSLAGERLRMVVVGPRDQNGASTAPLVRELRRKRPAVPLLAYCRVGSEQSRDIIDLASAGVHELVFRDVTDVGHLLRRTLASASQNCGAGQAISRLAGLVPPDLHPLIEYCLYFPELATSVPRVAAALGVHRKTLANYCLRAGAPAPSAFIAWCRLIIVAHLLETRDASVERIALELDYPSATALRNMLRRYTGCRPAELRARGMDRVLTAFTVRLMAHARVA